MPPSQLHFTVHPLPNSRFVRATFASNSRSMHLFQAPLDTCLNSPLLRQHLSSRFALHGLRAFKLSSVSCFGEFGRHLELGRLEDLFSPVLVLDGLALSKRMPGRSPVLPGRG